MKKTLYRMLSAIMIAVMLFSLASMTFATAPSFTVSAPTAERIYCVMNNYITDTFGYLGTCPGYEYLTVDGEPNNNIKITSLVNDDGTFTEYTVSMFEEALRAEVENGTITEEQLEQIGFPADIYEAFEAVTELLYYTIATLLESFGEFVPEAAEACAAFVADYPNGAVLHAEVIEKYFDGNEKPAIEEILDFMVGDLIKINTDGEIEYMTSEPVMDDEGIYLTISDVIAPNGAFRETVSGRYESRNVFEYLKSWQEETVLIEDCVFSLVTGYTNDYNGYLYTIVPQYNYIIDENGNKIKDILKLVDENGTISAKGVSVRDYAVECLANSYDEEYIFEDYPEIPTGEYGVFLDEIMEKYVPSDEEDIPLIPDDPMAEAAVIVDEYIAMCREWGDSEETIYEDLLILYCGYEYDSSGYVYDSVIEGYVLDEYGNRIHVNDAYDIDGTLLIGDRKGENMYAIYKEYLAAMDTSAILKGDATVDGKVDLADITAMLKKIAHWNVDVPDTAADTNGDGNVDLADVTLAMKYIAGWEVELVY